MASKESGSPSADDSAALNQSTAAELPTAFPSRTVPSAQQESSIVSNDAADAGRLDLEKELTCSICTDILYQPLTLLDCLHTFCGSCLKEWFVCQVSNSASRRGRDGHAVTCPSCRASVRATQPNAMITTLLEMYLAANPKRGKSAEEREEIAKNYKPGELVIPSASLTSSAKRDRGHHEDSHRRRRGDEDNALEEADRQLMEQVRDASLRELEERSERRRRERPTRERAAARHAPIEGRIAQQQRDQRASSLEHQSSLRRMLSQSAVQLDEQAIREIIDEVMRESVGNADLDTATEDEISERVAEVLRRRERRQARPAHDEGRVADTSMPSAPSAAARAQTLDAAHGTRQPRHRRSISQDAASAASTYLRPDNGRNRASSNGESRNVNRLATDLDQRPQTQEAANERRRRSSETRRSTHPLTRANGVHVLGRESANGSSRPLDTVLPEHLASANREQALDEVSSTQQNFSAATSLPTVSTVPTVPSISCFICSKSDIGGGVHYTCEMCMRAHRLATKYSLCRDCYRLGRGCYNWFGFGRMARINFARHAPPGSEPPHSFKCEKYAELWVDTKPLVRQQDQGPGSAGVSIGRRKEWQHQTGVFCDVCSANANDCYWKCDTCNEGEWGYCNRCAQQGRHCSHPLRAFEYDQDTGNGSPAHSNNVTAAGQSTSVQGATLKPLTDLVTECDKCKRAIETAPLDSISSHPSLRRGTPEQIERDFKSTTFLHCPICQDGDYDLCHACYSTIPATSPTESSSWRWSCEQHHPMLITGFDSAQRRHVLDDWTYSTEVNPAEARKQSKLARLGVVPIQGHRIVQSPPRPEGSPNEGSAWNVLALWTRVPDPDVDDELEFPKHAVIEEAIVMNHEWSWGVFCRKGGYFPTVFGHWL